ncbi:MAG: ribokinase [Pontimonas sp.]|nr:ribokinase [Pontimonas sp.]
MPHAPLVVIGNANVDLTTYLQRAPEVGETVLGHNFSIGMGGKGANQAVAAARAGAHVSFIGRIGEDAFGDMVINALTGEGLELEHLGRVPGPSGVASIYVEDGGANRIAVFTGASGTLTSDSAAKAVESHDGLKILVSQLEIDLHAVEAALATARAKGAQTILNTAPALPVSEGILRNTTWLIANEVEIAAVLAGAGVATPQEVSVDQVTAGIEEWAKALECHVIVTLGDQGAIGHVPGDGTFHFVAEPVTAQDTVGAGDCFVGYFAAHLIEGIPWRNALAGGVLAASDSVTRAGAQSSYPQRSRSEQFRNRALDSV